MRFGSLLFLGGLAFSAATLPQRLETMYKSLRVAPMSIAESRVGDYGAAQLLGTIRLNHGEPAMPETQLDAEVLGNPLIKGLLKMGRTNMAARAPSEAAADWRTRVPGWYRKLERHQVKFLGVVWTAPVLVLLAAVGFFIFDNKGEARTTATLCHEVSWKLLVGLSAIALVARFGLDANLWESVPADLWKVPSAALLASAAVMKMVDLNAPVWNSTLIGLGAPLAASAAGLGLAGARAYFGV